MNKKRLRYCINTLIDLASKAECKDLHHKKSQQHELGFVCPVEYEIGKIISEVEKFVEEELS